jgi:hypothetical protein
LQYYFLFSEWSHEQNGKPVDFSTIPADELNVLLGKFYAEATPKSSDKRNRKMTAAQAK